MRVLLVDEDKPISAFVQSGLEAKQYEVDVAPGGREAEELAGARHYDLVVLDLDLSEIDGMEVLRRLRARDPVQPIMILSARHGVEDRVKALDSGADDYLSKPFELSELWARTRALLRRSGRQATEASLQVEDLVVDRLDRTVRRADKRIELTVREFALLEYLMRNAGRPVTRAMIMEHVWKLPPETTTNVVDVYINYLRKKIDGDSETHLIHTTRGVGYQIGSNGAAGAASTT
ncbi:MAG TPA: response regulator transcription factor [Terriglobia bacterium]|nr:response regulator transcription factor [Terriglobia bacterium]